MKNLICGFWGGSFVNHLFFDQNLKKMHLVFYEHEQKTTECAFNTLQWVNLRFSSDCQFIFYVSAICK